MKKRIYAVLALVVTLSTLGVTIFAQEPNITSPAVEYLGYWQNAPQNNGTPLYWSDMDCPTCGASGYTLQLPNTTNTPELNNGDIFAVITDNEVTRNESYYDMGLILDVETSHTTSDHKNGILYTWQLSNSQVVFTTLPKTTYTQANFVWLICPTTARGYTSVYEQVENNVVGNINNYVRGYAAAFVVQTFYTDVLTDAIIDTVDTDAYQRGYTDGQINGQANANAIDYVGVLIDGVAQPVISTFSQISFFGVSILTLVGLVVSVTLIMTIIKIIRG